MKLSDLLGMKMLDSIFSCHIQTGLLDYFVLKCRAGRILFVIILFQTIFIVPNSQIDVGFPEYLTSQKFAQKYHFP